MKRAIVISCLIMLACIFLAGCDNEQSIEIVPVDGIDSIVTSLTWDDVFLVYHTTDEEITRITDFVNALTLSDDFSYEPGMSEGAAYDIVVNYTDGSQITFVLSGRHIMVDGEWLGEMEYEQASQFEAILRQESNN